MLMEVIVVIFLSLKSKTEEKIGGLPNHYEAGFSIS